MDTDMKSEDNVKELNNIIENNFCHGINPTNNLSSIPANFKNIINPQLSESSNSGFISVKRDSLGSSLNGSSMKDNAAVSENIRLETQSISNHSNVRVFSADSIENNSITTTKIGEFLVSININFKPISNNSSPSVEVSQTSRHQPSMKEFHAQKNVQYNIMVPLPENAFNFQNSLNRQTSSSRNMANDIQHSVSKKISDKRNKQSKLCAQGIAKSVIANLHKESTNMKKEKDALKEKKKNSSKKSVCSSDVGSYKELRFGKWDSVLFKNATKNTNKSPKPKNFKTNKSSGIAKRVIANSRKESTNIGTEKDALSDKNKRSKLCAQGIAKKGIANSHKESTNIGIEKDALKGKNKNSSKKSICSSDVGNYKELRLGKWDSVLFQNATKDTNRIPKPKNSKTNKSPKGIAKRVIANSQKESTNIGTEKDALSDKNKRSKLCAQGIAKKVIANSHKKSTNIGIEKDALKDKNKNSSEKSISNCDVSSYEKMYFNNCGSVSFKNITKGKSPKPSSMYQKHISRISRNQSPMEVFQAQDITIPASKSTLNIQNHSSSQASIQPFSSRSIANQFTPPVLSHSLQTNYCSVRDLRLRKHGTINSKNTQAVSQVLKPESNYNNPSSYKSDMPLETRNKTLLPTTVNKNQRTLDISLRDNFPLSKDQKLNNQSKNTFAPQSPSTITPPPSPVTSDSNEFTAPGNSSNRAYPIILQHHSPYSFDLPTHSRNPRRSPFSPFPSPSLSQHTDNTHRRNLTVSYKVDLSLTELNNLIGKKIIPPNNALMLILSWVPSWLKEVELPNQTNFPPICGKKKFPLKNVNVKFINSLEHFNTFFPLILHDLFFRILETQKPSYKSQRLTVSNLDINEINHVDKMVEVVAKLIYTKKMTLPSEGQIGIATFTFTDGLNKDAFVYVSDVKYSRETDGENHDVLYLYLKTNFNLTSVDKTKKITLIVFYHLEVLYQIKSLILLDELAVRDTILNPTKPKCTKVALETVGAAHTSLNIINRAVEKIKEGLAIENPNESKILIVDSPLGTDLMSTLIALVEDMKSSENETETRSVLICVRSPKHLENVGLRLLSAATSNTYDSAIKTVILTNRTNVEDPELKKLTLHEQINCYVERKKNEVLPSKSSIDLRTEAQKFVLENCDVVLSDLVLCYEPTVDSVLGMQGSTHFLFCIIYEAYTCTEPECCLPFLYGIRKLALVGDPSVKPKVFCHSIVKYNYYRSLAERLSKQLLRNDV